jgi:hypothetical protein
MLYETREAAGPPSAGRLPVKLLVLGATLALSACGPALVIHRQLPPTYDVGASRNIAVQVVAGPPDLSTVSLLHAVKGLGSGESQDVGVPVDELQRQLSNALVESRYFTPAATPGDADLLFQLTVTQWWTQQWDRQLKASLQSQLQVSRRDGHPLATQKYATTAQLPIADGTTAGDWEPSLLSSTIQQMVAAITHDFAPTGEDRRIPLDDSAPEVKAAVALMAKGELLQARAELERLLGANPGLAAVHYNLGVLEEGQSDFPAAEQRFLRAEQLQSRQLYRDALRRVSGLRRGR